MLQIMLKWTDFTALFFKHAPLRPPIPRVSITAVQSPLRPGTAVLEARLSKGLAH